MQFVLTISAAIFSNFKNDSVNRSDQLQQVSLINWKLDLALHLKGNDPPKYLDDLDKIHNFDPALSYMPSH